MRRKITCLLCAALAVISLLTTIAVPASAKIHDSMPEEEEEFRLFSVSDISAEERNHLLQKQANNNFYVSWTIMDGEWIYYLNMPDSFTSLAKMRTDGTDKSKLDVDWQLNNRFPLFVKMGFVYYLRYNGNQWDLYRCLSSGNNMECIASNVYLKGVQMNGEYIYYCSAEVKDENGKISDQSCHLYRCNLDGSGGKEILSKPVYDVSVFDDKVMYQDYRDGQTLHIYNMTTQNDKKITNRVTYDPLYTGYGYCYTSEDHRTIYMMNCEGQEVNAYYMPGVIDQLSIFGDYFYFRDPSNGDIYRFKIVFSGSEFSGSEIEEVAALPTKWGYGWVGSSLTYVTEDWKVYLCDWDGSNKYELTPVQ